MLFLSVAGRRGLCSRILHQSMLPEDPLSWMYSGRVSARIAEVMGWRRTSFTSFRNQRRCILYPSSLGRTRTPSCPSSNQFGHEAGGCHRRTTSPSPMSASPPGHRRLTSMPRKTRQRPFIGYDTRFGVQRLSPVACAERTARPGIPVCWPTTLRPPLRSARRARAARRGGI